MLSVRDLCAGYQGGRVLNGIALDVAAGRVTALLGRNGMGKTTLLRTLMGLLPVAAGSIRFDGADITALKPYQIAHRGMAYVPQGREIFDDFTVEENLLLGRLGRPRSQHEIPATVLDRFPLLAERLSHKAGTLSGGQQQLLAIARALVSEPKLLLLDEPSEGIQPSIVEEISDLLAGIVAAQGLSILLVEQNVDLVCELAADCAFIEEGQVVARHGVDEVRRDPAILQRYLAL